MSNRIKLRIAFPIDGTITMTHSRLYRFGSKMKIDSAPLISIIVPVYNAERFLPYCVESIMNQSYQNLEIILVDDGSKDGSPALCDEYASRDARIVVIHQDNGGISRAQNAGLNHAHGEYIAFADNDDILDRRNLEILYDALIETGSDMSKARWSHFGVSRLDEVAKQASEGAEGTGTRTVITDPLNAYQSVYCKTLRILGDKLGRHTEARYFNEANWCRLYKAELWDGIRFPEGMYAQDVMVAGELYLRMQKVVDVDLVLYHWLQSSGSVTHNERYFSYFRDNLMAGTTNFKLCLQHGVTPSRSFYTIMGASHEETTAVDFDTPINAEQHRFDLAEVKALVSQLTLRQHLVSVIKRRIRLFEKRVYAKKIKSLK